MSKNQYGLSRVIDPEVKFEVRKRSGFGCVICGLGIYHYDHIEPEFKVAKNHDPAGITLLCGRHHDLKTRGFLSTSAVKNAMKKPKALEDGFSKEILDVGAGFPTLIMGNFKFQNVVFPILVENRPIMRMLPPEIDGGPFRFSALFTDSAGVNTLEIYDNEWYASTGNWDIETVAGKLVVKENYGKQHLVLRAVSTDAILVEYLNMNFDGYLIQVGNGELYVEGSGCKFTGLSGGQIKNSTKGVICENGTIKFILG